jgi:hypothetical protein
MYSEFLGQGYHDAIRKMLVADKDLLPDSVIDADLNIGAMKAIIGKSLSPEDIADESKFNQLVSAARYYLCGVLCLALKSRTSAPPFNIPKYKKNWDKKRKNYMTKGNQIILGLRSHGRKVV